MIKAKVNNKYDFVIEKSTEKDFNIIKIQPGIFHILKDNKSYSAEVIKANVEEKSFAVRINGNKYTVQFKDKYDELLEKLGMGNSSSLKVKDVKAPMPGLVIDINIKENDSVKKGDGLIVLQAMKMENIIKSPTDAVVKKIHIKKGDALEKNQVMITFG
ncbi:MAG TPA: biotin/lipoyl-containing protein [Bacteroidia bacterium]